MLGVHYPLMLQKKAQIRASTICAVEFMQQPSERSEGHKIPNKSNKTKKIGGNERPPSLPRLRNLDLAILTSQRLQHRRLASSLPIVTRHHSYGYELRQDLRRASNLFGALDIPRSLLGRCPLFLLPISLAISSSYVSLSSARLSLSNRFQPRTRAMTRSDGDRLKITIRDLYQPSSPADHRQLGRRR
ncbi:hypothetical protein L484_019850 [Morus notabilis]|uniref:Uncharacterized protein n=1 Tax=Morus notabilis TaxID=981085 RepID=W9SHT0_9ROSA|nr:hypothetical protein L484_019850 [Morus notabilis]